MPKAKTKTKTVSRELKLGSENILEAYFELHDRIKGLKEIEKRLSDQIKEKLRTEPSGYISHGDFEATLSVTQGQDRLNLVAAKQALGDKLKPFLRPGSVSERLSVKLTKLSQLKKAMKK